MVTRESEKFGFISYLVILLCGSSLQHIGLQVVPGQLLAKERGFLGGRVRALSG